MKFSVLLFVRCGHKNKREKNKKKEQSENLLRNKREGLNYYYYAIDYHFVIAMLVLERKLIFSERSVQKRLILIN